MDRHPITRAEALAMLAECFMEAPQDLAPHRLRAEIPGWDSMGALMFIAELDARFGLELPSETSRAMVRVSDALDFLAGHGLLAD